MKPNRQQSVAGYCGQKPATSATQSVVCKLNNETDN